MPYKNPQKRKEYQRKYQEKWREENRDKVRKYQREYYWRNRDKIRKRKNKQNQNNEQSYFVRARRYHRQRIEILKRYGGKHPKCNWCGEERYECLQIDHINDDGAQERKERDGGENFYYWLTKQPYQPDKYQVLCANCNHIKRIRGNIPQQKGFKNIDEWEKWAQLKVKKAPEEIKKLWQKKRES